MGTYENFIFKRTYARFLEEKGRRENWHETVNRYDSFFRRKVPKSLMFKWEEAISSLRKSEVMPSMRALWSAGKALEESEIACYNCSYMPIEDPKCFSELLYILMHGTGVGFSVERQYVNKLPHIPKLKDVPEIIKVGDSKLGWASALHFFIKSLYKGEICQLDYSEIRPRGTPLKTFGGRASGKEPLINLIEFIKKTFINASQREDNNRLTSLECHDICCMIASIVETGGVRRSACLSLSNLSDLRMRDAKKGNFWVTDPHRGYANNSVAYTEKPDMNIFMEEWLALAQSGTGERGIFARHVLKNSLPERRDKSYDFGINPCFTGDTLVSVCSSDYPVTIQELAESEELEFYVWSAGYLSPKDDAETDKGCWFKQKKRATAFRTGFKRVIKLTLSNGDSIRCTDDHLLATKSGGYVRAINSLMVSLQDWYCGEDSSVYVVDIKEQGSETVYDLKVNDNNNFFVVTSYPKDLNKINAVLVHNCSEVVLRPYQFCNLTEAVVRYDDSLFDIERKVTAATVLGVIQSTMTNFNFLRPDWRRNCEEERLCGVSLTGIMDHPVLGDESNSFRIQDWLDTLKKVAYRTAERWSRELGINMATALTSVKPSGTVSQLVDASSGIHPRYSQYYVRRVRVTKDDPIASFMIAQGVPYSPEVGYEMSNTTNIVFEFPRKSPSGSVTRNEKSAIQQLNHWLLFQKHYCEHKPSITVYVRPNEWLEVGAWVYRNWNYCTGLSFLPYDSGFYKLAPYEEIDEEEYNSRKKLIPDSIDFDLIKECYDNTTGSKELACAGGACEI